jgi:hypothetical protein
MGFLWAMSRNTGMGEKSGMMSSNSSGTGGMMQGTTSQMTRKAGTTMSDNGRGSTTTGGMTSNTGMGQKSGMIQDTFYIRKRLICV